MNSLNCIGVTVRQTVGVLLIVVTVAIATFAQRVEASSQGKMYGEPGFRGEPINLNVVNADIRDILSYITDQYGINFIIDKSVLAVPVTVKVNEVPWNVALESVLQSQGLGVQVNGNILRIADAIILANEQGIRNKIRESRIDDSPLETEFFRLNYARAEGTLSAVADAAGQSQLSAGTNTSANVPVGTIYGNAADVTRDGSSTRRSITSDTGEAGILGIIQKRMSKRGSIEVDKRTNTLIITDVRENFASIRKLINYLDQPEPQVEIEARIVVASRTFSRDIGVQLGALLNGARGSGIMGGTLPGAPSIQTPNPGIPTGSVNNSLYSQIANTAIGLTTGVFGTAQISALISAGEQKGQAKVIATPRVTTLNNRPAEIKSGTKIPITTIQPGSAAGGAVIATTTYVDVPLRLAITPQITDVGTVILDVTAENSSTASVVSGAPPAINSQSMRTQVTVPDGGTTVVGGVLFDDERESTDRTPGVSRIPIFGNLFKRKGVQRNTNEILFFITPRITRPDYNATVQNGAGPRPTTIFQPVPLGNPPSNSSPTVDTPPVVLQAPAIVRPEAVPPSVPGAGIKPQ